MKKIFQILLTFFFLVGCSTAPQTIEHPQKSGNNDWIYGMWLTVSVSDKIVALNMQKGNTDVEKHILFFKYK